MWLGSNQKLAKRVKKKMDAEVESQIKRVIGFSCQAG